ncbi:MAG: O-phosphoserine--tRNA ligase [Candidatus Altiarchaeota archaeon]
MAFNTREIKESSREDFRKAWLETASLIPGESSIDYSGGAGRPHAIHDLIQDVRIVFLKLGFDEVENPIFVSEEDVYKQYGPEAPVILDRCYYLAGLPRPDIGLSDETAGEIRKIADVKIDALKNIFRQYRAGEIEGDDMVEEMVKRLKLDTEEASQILGLFPEFKNITPQAGKNTLRSHMTAAWFPTLAAMQDVYDLPMKLFSVGLRFRREQKVDSSHLRAHYGGSCVIMGEDISLKAGKKLTEEILNALDFGDVRFELKKATSNYYAPKTEYEVYSGDIEVADIGMYSPVALANYEIRHNVFNLGFGLERILMVKNKVADVREVLYPHMHGRIELDDSQLAGEVGVEIKPSTKEGKMISDAIVETASANAEAKSPCEFTAYKGNVGGRNVEVKVVEREKDTMLLGPAALNQVYAYDGNLYGLPEDTSKLKANMAEALEKGVNSGVSFIRAVADYAAAEIESASDDGTVRFKMAKTPADVNILVKGKARRFILSHNKTISVKGPVFTSIEYSFN